MKRIVNHNKYKRYPNIQSTFYLFMISLKFYIIYLYYESKILKFLEYEKSK